MKSRAFAQANEASQWKNAQSSGKKYILSVYGVQDSSGRLGSDLERPALPRDGHDL